MMRGLHCGTRAAPSFDENQLPLDLGLVLI